MGGPATEKKEQSGGSLKEEMAEFEEVTRGKSPIQHKLSSKRRGRGWEQKSGG